MTLTRIIMSALAGLMIFAAAPASAVIIDDFQNATNRTTGNGIGTTVFAQTNGSNIIGGERDTRLTISGDTDPTDINVASFGVGGGSLVFNNDSGVVSTLSVLWDGSGDNATTNEYGLGGVDLTDGGATSGLVFTASADHDAVITVTFYEDANNFSTGTLSLTGDNTEQTLTQLYSGLVDNIGGASLNAVNAIELTVSTNGSVQDLDLQISALGTPSAPEPGALALIGLMALGGAFWRKKAA